MSSCSDVFDVVFEKRWVGPEFGLHRYIDGTADLRCISFIFSLCRSSFGELGFDFDDGTVVDIRFLLFGKRWCPYPEKDEEEGDGQDGRQQKHLIRSDSATISHCGHVILERKSLQVLF